MGRTDWCIRNFGGETLSEEIRVEHADDLTLVRQVTRLRGGWN